VILFGLPFFIMGTILFIIGLTMLVNVVKAEGWQKIPAEILTLNIKIDSDGELGSVETLYQYTYNRTLYQGTLFSFDNNNVEKVLVDGVREREAAYCFVNPDNPAESVLVKHLPESANMIIPGGICFMLLGVGLILGPIQQTVCKRKAEELFKQARKIPADRIGFGAIIIIVPLMSAFLLAFLNAFVISPWLGPGNTFLFTLFIMLLSVYVGWKLSRRHKSNGELEILCAPGRDRQFKVSLHFPEPTTGALAAVLTVYFFDEREEDKTKQVLLSVPFIEDEVYDRRRNFSIDSGSIKTGDMPHLDDKIPAFMQLFTDDIKESRRYQDYHMYYQNAWKMAVALQGREDAGQAESGLQVDIEISGDMKLTFPLPQDIWAR